MCVPWIIHGAARISKIRDRLNKANSETVIILLPRMLVFVSVCLLCSEQMYFSLSFFLYFTIDPWGSTVGNQFVSLVSLVGGWLMLTE